MPVTPELKTLINCYREIASQLQQANQKVENLTADFQRAAAAVASELAACRCSTQGGYYYIKIDGKAYSVDWKGYLTELPLMEG